MRTSVFQEPELRLYDDTSISLSHAWERIRVPIIVPILQLAPYICIVMSVMLFVECVYMAIVIGTVKIFLVQVHKLSIGAACGLSWPSERLIVQVLDDSTNEALRVSLSAS